MPSAENAVSSEGLQPENSQTGSKKKKIILLISASSSLVVLFGLLIFFRPALIMSPLLKMQFYSKEKDPSLYIKPIKHEINASNFKAEVNSEISQFGVSLSSPWGEPLNTKELSSTKILYSFRDSHAILIDAPNPPSIFSTTNIAKTEEEISAFKKALGEETFLSNYMLHSRLLNLDPDRLSMLSSNYELTSMGIGLPMKQILTLGSSYIYEFSYGQIKGFQISTNTEKAKIVVLTLFDSNDNIYNIAIHNNPTQEEVDYIISTIKLPDATK